jgi:pyroglutamyl-peptidase
MRVLVTGFAPFGGHAENPSSAVARALDGVEFEGVRFLALAPLPVRYAEAAELALTTARTLQADAVVALGLAAGTAYVRVERRALNRATAPDPDGAGRVCADEDAVPGGATSLATGLDTELIVSRLGAAGLACAPSDDAGGYVCNDLYYRLLAAASRGEGPEHILFVHVPLDADRLVTLPGALAAAVAAALPRSA